jgi:hypothetical protein
MTVRRTMWLHARETTLIAVLAVYSLAICGVDLFHSEDCVSSSRNTTDSCVLYSKAPCPACSFSAASNSTEAHYETAATCLQSSHLPASLAQSTVILRCEWACSISLRAPPATDLS